MQKFINILFILTACLFILSCSDDSSTAPAKEEKKEIMPLTVGNEWEYGIDFYKKGKYGNSSTLILKVMNMKEIEGDSIYEMLLSEISGGSRSYSLLLEEDGLYNCTKSGSKNYMEVKYPVAKGDTYIQHDDGGAHKFIVESLYEEIETEAGTFTTIKYVNSASANEETGTGYYDVFYYCPGVGMVKNEEYMILSGGEELFRDVITLKSYKLK